MIRQAQLADADGVGAVVRVAYEGYVQALGRHPQPMDDDYVALIAANEVFVAEEDGDVVGVIVIQQPEPSDLLIRTIAIAPAHQNKGLGTASVAYAEKLADDRDITRIRLYTNEVMGGTARLYMRLGFAETHRSGPDGRQVIYMAKELPTDRTPWFDVIVTDADTCSGKPRIAGTRHYIDVLLALIEGGQSFDHILAEYPQLERAQLQAMIGFVRDLVASKRNALKGELRNG